MTLQDHIKSTLRSRTWERLEPFVFGAASAVLWFIFKPCFPESTSLLASSISIGAIFVGFLGAALALLLGLGENRIKKLRDAEYLDDLIRYFEEAILFSFLIIGVGLLGYFVERSGAWYGIIWIVSITTTTASVWRITPTMMVLLKLSGRGSDSGRS